jgi:glutathione S-transferase
MAMTLGKKSFGYANERLQQKGWWLGEPSIVDVYLNWALSVATKGGFDTSSFPHLAALPERLKQLPAFIAMPV